MHDEAKSFFEQRAHHQRKRPVGPGLNIAWGLGHDVESIGIDPVGATDDLEIGKRLRRAVCGRNQHLQCDVACIEPTARLKDHGDAAVAGLVRLDRRGLERGVVRGLLRAGVDCQRRDHHRGMPL